MSSTILNPKRQLSMLAGLTCLLLVGACSSVPKTKHLRHSFPKNAFSEKPSRPFKVLGPVRSKVEYSTLDFDENSKSLCQNYFNQAVSRLVRLAKKEGGDAVMGVRSVVFLMDGRSEQYAKPECFDNGAEGQILARGIAIRWLPEPTPKADLKN